MSCAQTSSASDVKDTHLVTMETIAATLYSCVCLWEAHKFDMASFWTPGTHRCLCLPVCSCFSPPSLSLSGCRGEDEAHGASLCYEDPQ